MTDTIFSLATVRGRSAIAVIRISGPEAFTTVEALTGHRPRDRLASLRTVRDPTNGQLLDEALILGFEAPHSYTGEDVAELQLHGSVAVCRLVLETLGQQSGLRQAEPGEFTRRALLAGRLNLSEVEGLGDLLAAETAAQHRQAVRAANGGLRRLGSELRGQLVHALALVEASIDFADEELPGNIHLESAAMLSEVALVLEREARGSRVAERLREGFEVALVGPPNIGKSTLLNALAGREVALTSELAGTTRDVLEVRMDLEGLPITMLDTAGLRDPGEHIEALGIERARARADAADLRVFLVEDPAQVVGLGVAMEGEDLVLLGKGDLRTDPENSVSGLTGAGIDALLGGISEVLHRRVSDAGMVSHARQRMAVEQAAGAVGRARNVLSGTAVRPEIAALEIHEAVRALDFLVGSVDVEAVLDVVFRNFCLGK